MELVPITPAQFNRAAGDDAELAPWRILRRTIQAMFDAPDYPSAARFVAACSEIAERAAHHPDIDLRYPGRVRVALTTHATGGLTTLDADVARQITAAATDGGLTVSSRPPVEILTVAIDTDDPARLRPFWMAVLDYRDAADELADPLRIGPNVWFQVSDEPRVGRNRIHLDLYVPEDQVIERLQDALAAGGRVVTDDYAPAWWVLADADGNEVCLSTWHEPGDVDTPESTAWPA